MEVLDPPVPVPGADGHMHLAYEVAIANQGSLDVTIDRVQPRSAGKPFSAAIEGDDFAERLRVFGHDGETTIPAGGNAMLFMDVRYPLGAPASVAAQPRLEPDRNRPER